MNHPESIASAMRGVVARIDERIAKLLQLRELLQDEALAADLPLLWPSYGGKMMITGLQDSKALAGLVGMEWGKPWWDKVSTAIAKGYLARIANGHLDLTAKGWDWLKLKHPVNVQPPAPHASALGEKQEVVQPAPVSDAPPPAPHAKVRQPLSGVYAIVVAAVRSGRTTEERLWTHPELIDTCPGELERVVRLLVRQGHLVENPDRTLGVPE
ncbi:MAG: hypothetical protein MUF01_02380 [Bryobacterales bacterium]|jgi:hypothetical protein|nr:hypothetical protein [Bryobacterales bacterium]